jgi:hypothetical protein
MRAKLSSSYELMGINVVPVDVIVKGNQVKVVAIESGRVLHKVTLLGRTLPEGSITDCVVNGRTLSLGRSAPARLITRLKPGRERRPFKC